MTAIEIDAGVDDRTAMPEEEHTNRWQTQRAGCQAGRI